MAVGTFRNVVQIMIIGIFHHVLDEKKSENVQRRME